MRCIKNPIDLTSAYLKTDAEMMSDALEREEGWLEEMDKVCEKKRLATAVEAEESSTDETLLVN